MCGEDITTTLRLWDAAIETMTEERGKLKELNAKRKDHIRGGGALLWLIPPPPPCWGGGDLRQSATWVSSTAMQAAVSFGQRSQEDSTGAHWHYSLNTLPTLIHNKLSEEKRTPDVEQHAKAGKAVLRRWIQEWLTSRCVWGGWQGHSGKGLEASSVVCPETKNTGPEGLDGRLPIKREATRQLLKHQHIQLFWQNTAQLRVPHP